MLSYPVRSSRAQGFLRRASNDIDIYVEDAARAAVWLSLIRKCLPTGKKLTKVMPLGDRDAVIAACRLDQGDGRARLYIIDGDFDYLLRRGTPRLRYLYKVPATNLESFVLKTNGLVPYLHSVLPERELEDLEALLREHLEEQWFRKLRVLFSFYAENQRINAGVETCNFHVSRLGRPGSRPWLPDSTGFATKAREVLAACKAKCAISKSQISIHKNQAKQLPIEKVASGKTYLLPLVEDYVKHLGAYPGNSIRLMLSVISHGGCPSNQLRQRIISQLK